MGVTLRSVTAASWYDLVALRVAPDQEAWVAPNYLSLLEASYGFTGDLAHLRLVPLGVYADDTPVGMTLYNTDPGFERFMIMRLMVDARHQGRGYGRAALTQLLGLFRAHPQAKEVAISYNVGNEPARRLYARCGFVALGPDDAGGVLMWQRLNEQPLPWTLIWNPVVAAAPPPAGPGTP